MSHLGTNVSQAVNGADQAPKLRGASCSTSSYPIVELRQYTLHEGRRDDLIRLFEKEFIESQEALGMKVIGTFTDLDRPERFVWIRGFTNMECRLEGLRQFYGGQIWKEHREEANSTMVDSDNVLLLNAPSASGQFHLPVSRPQAHEYDVGGLVCAAICYLNERSGEAAGVFEAVVKPKLEAAGIHPIAWFISETTPNNFPQLPVREDEKVLVWLAAFADESEHQAQKQAIEFAVAALEPLRARENEVLRLVPTARSLVRANTARSAIHDFDFLHGTWNVSHRRLKVRGAGSREWIEFEGTADTRSLLGGLCNVEEHRIHSANFSGVAFRCFNTVEKLWVISWVSQCDGVLQSPVSGRFEGSRGTFEGSDVDAGRPVQVRFIWQKQSQHSARWEQAFSYDRGSTWETNWTMEFERKNC